MAKIRRVLVVDNNATIVELLSAHLVAGGFEVAQAYDGLQALDRLVETDALPDVILLDLIMPRLDGQRLTRFLKQDPLYCAIPIVILTGIASEDHGTLLSFGADAYIAKGRIEDTMKHVLETFRWLEARGGGREHRNVVLGVEKLYPREMTRELLHIKGHLDTMLAIMDEGVVEIDQDHRILYANPAACRLLGDEDHRLFGKGLATFFGDPARVEAHLATLPCGAESCPPPLQLEHAHRMLRLTFSTIVEKSTYCGALVILNDVTAQVRRERSLLELREAIVRHAPVGLCLLDAEERILVANPAFGRILHQPDARVAVGATLREYLAGTGLAPESLLPPLGGAPPEGTHNVEYTTAVFPERVVLTTSATFVETAEGRRVLLLIEDVTEKAAMERDLRRVNEELAKANRAKSTFLSMVSHELRTPLSVVRGYLSLILEGKIGPDPARVQEALRVADKRARHLQHLIEELLDLSRIESGRLSLRTEPIAVRKHVLEVAEMFRDDLSRKRIELDVAIPEELPPALADHDKVHQIFTNFLSNAVKFTGEGGRIVISGRAADRGLEFAVSDTGIGIPPEKIDRIFDKFYQVDSSDKRLYPGTGLGLAIVKMIVAALGGTVRVGSEVGKGTTFTLTLPVSGDEVVAPPREQPAGPEAPPPKAAAERLRVLVVDDDADTLSLIRLQLPEARYEVIEAYDGFNGLRDFYFRSPHVVLADALLPLMSGLELCRIIKSHPERGALPVIMLSAAAQEEEIRRGYQAGADAYLVKPFSSQDLLDTLSRLLPAG
jgi:signal transduction histidine kinase/DNA-binding response OmpR family regulator